MPETAHKIGVLGWYHVLFFGVFLPLLVIRNGLRLRNSQTPLPNRIKHFQSTVTTLLLFSGISLFVSLHEWIFLFPPTAPPLVAIVAGVSLLLAAILFMRPRWRRAVERRARVVYLFMPDNAIERAWWIAVSVAAGIGEEITWRGAQTELLHRVTNSYLLAALLSAISFALAHAIQGWRSCAIIILFAVGFQSLVWLADSLYVAMAVHVLYDMAAGLHYGRLGRQLGYNVPASESAGPGTVAPS